MEPELADLARESLESLGVTFLMDTTVDGIGGEPGALRVECRTGGGPAESLTADHVLLAVGRRPNLDGLDVEAAGISTDERGRLVVDGLRTTNPTVWAAGDVAGGPQYTPVASDEGALVARAILTGEDHDRDYSTFPTTVFTVPQLGMVGMGEEAAQQAGISYSVKRLTFEYVGGAIISDERRGLVKVLVDGDDRIIGAHIAHPQASDLIYPYALAVANGLTAAAVAQTRAVHPSFAEAVNWATW
jgi:mercuric reductase